MSKNEIKKATVNLPAKMDFGADAGLGRENEDGDERSIPQIVLVQKGNPQVEDGLARPGQLFNLATNTAIDPPLTIIPAAQDRWFIHKDKDRNFMGKYRVTHPLVMRLRKEQGKYGKLLLEPEKEKSSEFIQETRYLYYVIVNDDGTFSRAVTPFKSAAGLVPWGSWKEIISQYQEALWQKEVLPKGQKLPYPALLTVLDVKDDRRGNDTFKSFDFNPGVNVETFGTTIIMPDDARYQAAKYMAEALQEGALEKVDEAKTEAPDDDGSPY